MSVVSLPGGLGTPVNIIMGDHFALLGVGEYYCDFSLYEYSESTDGQPSYGYEHHENLADAQPIATGFVKWDQCHEIQITNYHGCSPDDLAQLFEHIKFALDIGYRLIPKACERNFMPDWDGRDKVRVILDAKDWPVGVEMAIQDWVIGRNRKAWRDR